MIGGSQLKRSGVVDDTTMDPKAALLQAVIAGQEQTVQELLAQVGSFLSLDDKKELLTQAIEHKYIFIALLDRFSDFNFRSVELLVGEKKAFQIYFTRFFLSVDEDKRRKCVPMEISDESSESRKYLQFALSGQDEAEQEEVADEVLQFDMSEGSDDGEKVKRTRCFNN